MSSRAAKKPVGNRRQKEQQKQRQLHSRQSSSSDVSQASRSAWDVGPGQTRPVTPNKRGEVRGRQPNGPGAGGKSRRAKDRAEDNAGSALKAKRQLDGIVRKLKDNNAENHPSEINLESCRVGDRGAVILGSALRSNASVQRMMLGGCDITFAGLRSLRDAMKETRGSVYGAPLVSIIRRIELCTRKVPKVGNPLGNHGAECLAEVIRASTSLRHVNASCCSIGDEGASSLADAVAASPSLVTLELDQNVIGNTGAVSIGQALAANNVLQGMSLWKNRIGSRGAEGLSNGLIANTSLQWIGLGCNKIGDEGASFLARALSFGRGKSQLTWLAIGGNNITDEGGVHIARALQGKNADELEMSEDDDQESTIDDASDVSLPRLKSLGIGGNDITDESAEAFGAMLLENDVLLSLGLGDCNIGDEGVRNLAIGLRGNDSLQRLILSGNCIGDEGAGYLASSLSQNQSLKSLYLAENPISDDGGYRFQEVLCGHYNRSLATLDVHETDMSVKGFTELCNALRQNSHLQQLGTHLPVIDLTSSTMELSPSGDEDVPDGGGESGERNEHVGVLKTVRGNAMMGQKMLKAAGSFKTASAAAAGGFFRARGSATAAAIQAIPAGSDDLTSAEVALEGYRSFEGDDVSESALEDGLGRDGKTRGSKFLNLFARRSYVFSDRNSLKSPTGSEGRKKRWSIFGSRRGSTVDLSGSQTELISLSEDQKHGSMQFKSPRATPANLSQSSLPPPPLPDELDFPDGQHESSLTEDGDDFPPPPVHQRRHSPTRRPPPVETITEEDGREDDASSKPKKNRYNRDSIVVDPDAALSGGWRQDKHGAVRKEKRTTERFSSHLSQHADIIESEEEDKTLSAWAAQMPTDGNEETGDELESASPEPLPLEPMSPEGTENELEKAVLLPEVALIRDERSPQRASPTKKGSKSSIRDSLRRLKDDDSSKEGKKSPLLARLSTPRRSKKSKKRQFDTEEVTVQQVLMESAKASGNSRDQDPVRVSVTSQVANPYHSFESLEYGSTVVSPRHSTPASPLIDNEMTMTYDSHPSNDDDDVSDDVIVPNNELRDDVTAQYNEPVAVKPDPYVPLVAVTVRPHSDSGPGVGASPVLPTQPLEPIEQEAEVDDQRQQPINTHRRNTTDREEIRALSQKLHAILPQQQPSTPTRKLDVPPELAEGFDETDLAIQHISRSASNLEHVTKSRSRPSGRRLPSRETSKSNLQQTPQQQVQLSSPISNTSDGVATDETARLLPDRSASPLSTPPSQDESLLQRLVLLKNGDPLQEQFEEVLESVDKISYQHDTASSSRYVEKIRPNATLAPDKSLTTLLGIERVSDFTFINASYVGNVLDQRLVVATQAPLTDYISDFWRLVWEHRVRVIIALTTESDGYTAGYSSEVEQDFDLVEATSQRGTQGRIYPSALKVIHTPKRVHSIGNVTSQEYVLESSRTMETRSVLAYHYNAWTLEGHHGSISNLSLLIEEALAKKRKDEPILVHCKDGGVRTGTMAAMLSASHIMLSAGNRRSQANLHEGDTSLDAQWLNVADQRPGFAHVQTAYRMFLQATLGCVFGSDAVRGTDLAASTGNSRRNSKRQPLFGKNKSKKKPKK